VDSVVEDLYVLIIAGGRGARFWPRSRRDRPKQCLPVQGELSLLQATIRRVVRIVPPERILVITADDMAESVRAHILDVPLENVLVEPEGRNTAACVGWGAVEVARRAPGVEAIMAVLPADHLISDEESFARQIGECAQAARATNALVTLGVVPTHPETGFGYLELGSELDSWGDSAFLRVAQFVEKPDFNTAERYLESGRYLWNAGMFVFTVEAIRDAFRAYLPTIWGQLERLRHSPELLADVYPEIERISIDYGIMERSEHVLTVRAQFGWSDVGSWSALGEHLPVSELGRALVEEAVAINSFNNVVYAPGKAVAVIGVSDLVIVDTEDALLVCRKSDAQSVKEVVAELEKRGKDSLV
jgi:mannose-1-phosphate guanylyltransferase